MINKNSLFNFFMLVLLAALSISKGIASVATVGLLLTSLYEADFEALKQTVKKYPHVAVLGLLTIAYIIGIAYSDSANQGFLILLKSHRFLVFPLIILLNVGLVKQNLHRYFNFFLLGLSIASAAVVFLLLLPEPTVIKLAQEFPIIKDYPLTDDRLRYGLYSPFIDRIQFSDLLGIGVVISMYLTLKTSRKLIYSGLAVFLLFTTMLLGGRGGQIGLFGGMCVFFIGYAVIFQFPKLQRRIGKMAALSSLLGAVFVLVIVVPLTVYELVPSVKKRYNQMLLELRTFSKDEYKTVNYEHNTTVRRIVSWQNHWEIVKKHPLIGVGTGQYENELAKAYATDNYDLPVNSHSQYLHLWVTLGLWGLLLFLGIIFYWLKILAAPTLEYILALAFMAHYLISFLPDAVLLTQIDAMAFSLFFSFIGILKERNATATISEKTAAISV